MKLFLFTILRESYVVDVVAVIAADESDARELLKTKFGAHDEFEISYKKNWIDLKDYTEANLGSFCATSIDIG